MFGFGNNCKQMIKYNGTSIDLSGLNLDTALGGGPLKFGIGALKVKPEVIQAAAEFAQLLDAVQFANCQKIKMVSGNSPERIKIINEAMESERQLIQLTFMIKAITLNPSSEQLQKALAEWISSQNRKSSNLYDSVTSVKESFGDSIEYPSPESLKVSFEKAQQAEPFLADASGIEFDFNRILEELKV